MTLLKRLSFLIGFFFLCGGAVFAFKDYLESWPKLFSALVAEAGLAWLFLAPLCELPLDSLKEK